MTNLEGLTQLQWLDLSATKVTDVGIDRLKGLKQLRLLYLQDTPVTHVGVEKINQALPYCAIGRELPTTAAAEQFAAWWCEPWEDGKLIGRSRPRFARKVRRRLRTRWPLGNKRHREAFMKGEIPKGAKLAKSGQQRPLAESPNGNHPAADE